MYPFIIPTPPSMIQRGSAPWGKRKAPISPSWCWKMMPLPLPSYLDATSTQHISSPMRWFRLVWSVLYIYSTLLSLLLLLAVLVVLYIFFNSIYRHCLAIWRARFPDVQELYILRWIAFMRSSSWKEVGEVPLRDLTWRERFMVWNDPMSAYVCISIWHQEPIFDCCWDF